MHNWKHFLNLFHGGRLATMLPKLVNEEGDLFLYRPLGHVAEADYEKFARAMNYPTIPRDLCGSQDGLQLRKNLTKTRLTFPYVLTDTTPSTG